MIKIQFIGHLGHDAHVRDVVGVSQKAITFSVAVTERWKDKSGNAQEKTIWINCTLWRPLDSNTGEYLKKGTQVYVEGEPSVKAWNKPDDNTAQAAQECRVNKIEFLSKSKSSQDDQPF